MLNIRFNGNAFSEGGQRNEMGLLLGLAWTINRFLTANILFRLLFCKTTLFSFGGKLCLDNLSTVYTRNNFSFLVRYRFKIRQKDNANSTGLANEYMHEHTLHLCSRIETGRIKYN